MITRIAKLSDMDQSTLIAHINRCPIGIPTETVYGLAAPLANSDMVRRIYAIKHRPTTKPLTVHISGLSMLYPIVQDVPAVYKTLMHEYWPGPLTLLFLKQGVPDYVTPSPHVGIRMPDHPEALSIIHDVGAVVAPSANISGCASPMSAQQAARNLDGMIELVVDGGVCRYGVASTIFTCYGDDGDDECYRILRHGAITQEMIENVLGISIGDHK